MNKYTSENRYYKYFNEYGRPIRIKISKHIELPGSVLIKFKSKNEINFNIHSTSHKFSCVPEIISYICKHAEESDIFKVV